MNNHSSALRNSYSFCRTECICAIIQGSAVKFESQDVLKSAAASLAATQVEKKFDEFLAKIGLKSGAFTFTTTVKGKPFNGTYTLSEDGTTLAGQYDGMKIGLELQK